MQGVFPRANIDLDIFRLMASLGHNGLMPTNSFSLIKDGVQQKLVYILILRSPNTLTHVSANDHQINIDIIFGACLQSMVNKERLKLDLVQYRELYLASRPVCSQYETFNRV